MELIIVFIIIIVVVVLCVIKEEKCKEIGLIGGWIIVLYITYLNICYNNMSIGFQYKIEVLLGLSGLNLWIGVDGLSLCFLELTSILIPISILVSWLSVKDRVKEFIILLYILELMLFGVFSVLNIFWFYIFFEAVLIPMFLIIGFWGSRTRKVHAAYQFFLYTLIGSLFMLMAIIMLSYSIGSLNIENILEFELEENRQIYVWLCMFLGFSVKIPLVPFHIWLPEAHVEAPTAGSVLLAGILLKLGGYGFLRFLIPVLPYANIFFSPLVQMIGLIGVVYGSLVTIRQIDIKKIIAYSSVAHMGYVVMGLFSYNYIGLEGSIVSMISHGLVSSGLFICVGLLYERYGTRLVIYYSGLVNLMPLFSLMMLVLILSNIGIPGSMSFVGEFYIMQGLFFYSSFLTIVGGLSMILGAVYSIWLMNRMLYGQVITITKTVNKMKENYMFLNFISYKTVEEINSLFFRNLYEFQKKGETIGLLKYSDIVRREVIILFIIIFGVIVGGVFPVIIIEQVHYNIFNMLEKYHE